MSTSPKGLWVEWLQAGDVASSTIRLRSYAFDAYARTVENPLAATPSEVAAYLSNPQWSTETRRSRKATLRSFYKFARKAGLLEVDPTEDLHPIRASKSLPKPVPEDALALALRNATPEQRLMLMLGAYAGLRRNEIRTFHSDAVTDVGLVICGKGDVQRRIPIHERLRPLLQDVHGWAFPSPVKLGEPVGVTYIEDRMLEVLPRPYTAHCLRHRFATTLLRAGVNVRIVQRLMGHAKLETTALYLQVIDDELDDAIGRVA